MRDGKEFLPAAAGILVECICYSMQPNEFRRIALSMSEAFESAHMGHADFRVNGKIFATLGYPDEHHGMVVIPPDEQARFMQEEPDVFSAAAGAWGRRGSTIVNLRKVKPGVLRRAVTLAWQGKAPQDLCNSDDL